MQVEAIMHAAADIKEADASANPCPRLMIPLVGNVSEFKHQALEVKAAATRVLKERKMNIPFEIGTMIEVPRAALISDQLAGLLDEADNTNLCNFFSYGTNDLTQMTMGISRY
jgi:pyruvate,orthophosphate dikinase